MQQNYHPLHLNTSLLQSLPFPLEVKEELQMMEGECSTGLIQRVSEETFMVRNLKWMQEYQFSVIHLRFSKPKLQSTPTPPIFHCPCSTYRRFLLAVIYVCCDLTLSPTNYIHKTRSGVAESKSSPKVNVLSPPLHPF